jgi:hypothetical protein
MRERFPIARQIGCQKSTNSRTECLLLSVPIEIHYLRSITIDPASNCSCAVSVQLRRARKCFRDSILRYFAAASLREFKVKRRQAVQDIRRYIFVAARIRRTVLLFGDTDVRRPIEKTLESHTRLEASERCPGARVKAAAERNMVAYARALELKLVRLTELSRIPICRAQSYRHQCARREIDAADRSPRAGEPEIDLRRTLQPQRLFDEIRDPMAVDTQALL